MSYVAGALTNVSIPLHIIYVNEDDGKPPMPDYRIDELVEKANEVFDGFLDFYICGYGHVNSTNYTNFVYSSDKIPLYNAYHVDDAVNIYIVQSISGNSGLADFPFTASPNNMIWITNTATAVPGPYVLAHELGHYFGLFHTHSVPYVDEDHCLLKNPDTEDSDMVPDTPVDPGPNSMVTPECPTAITPVTLTCNINVDTATYTYVGYYTDNVMSYYFCSTERFTDGQKARMEYYLNDNASRNFLLTTSPACKPAIAEVGFVNKYCVASTPSSSEPVKSINVKMHNEETTWESQDKTDTNGEYELLQSNFSNATQVTLKPQRSHPNVYLAHIDPDALPVNYHPLSGVTTTDMARIQRHILNMLPLPKPYPWIAADANNSGSITTTDIVEIRKVILGLIYDYPAGTWRFVPEYYFNDTTFETGFLNFPFTAAYDTLGYPEYLDQVTLDMENTAVSQEENWSFNAIKVGDVNCSMILDTMPSPSNLFQLVRTSSQPAIVRTKTILLP